jgi:hypothetical protein
VTLNPDATQDVTLTSRENLAAGNSIVPPRVPGTRTISGVVFEVTETGRRPVENMSVGWEADMDWVAAWTFTDARGRYLLCGLPETRLTLFAATTTYPNLVSYITIEAGSDALLDIKVGR